MNEPFKLIFTCYQAFSSSEFSESAHVFEKLLK